MAPDNVTWSHHLFEELDWRKRRTYGKHFQLVADGRDDCPIIGKMYTSQHPGAPIQLLPEWEHLLDGEGADDDSPHEERAEPLLDALDFRPFPAASEEGGAPALPYSVVIAWSKAEGGYCARLPEWESTSLASVIPVIVAGSYAEVAHEAYFVLRDLVAEARRRQVSLPSVG